MGESEVVTIERQGPVALVAVANPPVNAASHAVRAGLMGALETLSAAPGVEVIALYGTGRTFVAGADIREFGAPPKAPVLTELCSAIEACTPPVIAILHGTPLGGGLEIALAAQARVALPGTRVGLPEVTLGIIPGAGGTQRAPRLIGIAPALDLITSGRQVAAAEALELGLIDRIAEGAPRDVALDAAADALAGTLPLRRTGSLTVDPNPEALAAARQRLTRTAPHLLAPHRAVDAVEAALGPLEEGLVEERRLFTLCHDSPQRAGLIHAFFAERAVARIPERAATPREVSALGVVGGGTMGVGIAAAALLAGLPVTLIEQDADRTAAARARLGDVLDGAVKRGKVTAAERDALLTERLAVTERLDALADVDLVIEAVFEDMAVKRDLFARLDGVCRPGAILATNTSYLDIGEIAAATARPADVLGLHFFSPAHVMRLLEVVVTPETAPEVVATGVALGKRMRKVAVRAGVCDGFIGNRILMEYRRAADYMMLDGASPQVIDAALEGFGFAMGPFAVADLAGLDIGWATRKRRAPTRPADERYVTVADSLCERGWFGRKTGRGFYLYDGGKRVGENPDLPNLLDAARATAGVEPRAFDAEEIVARYLTAMIAEAVRVLEDGIALRPSDIDAVLLFGYGFPRHHGGPLHLADAIGAATLVARIDRWAEEDPQFWRVPAMLRRLADEGGTFGALNTG